MKLQAMFAAFSSRVSPDGAQDLTAIVDPHAAWRACGGRISQEHEVWDDFLPSRQEDVDLCKYVRRRVLATHPAHAFD